MTKQRSDNLGSSPTLRERAEQALRTSRSDIATMSPEDVQRLVHELQVHQIELEMQNDELQTALAELEVARDRFVDLYDFAPVGYLTLNTDGVILEANLTTAASILAATRHGLVGHRFALSIADEDRDRLHQHLQQLAATSERHSCRLAVDKTEDSPTTIHLESIAHHEAEEIQFRVTISDVTRTTQLEEALEEKTLQLRWADALPVLLCYLDTELRYQYTNATHAEWFGSSPERLRGRLLRHTIPEPLYEQMEDHLTDALLGREVTFEVTVNRHEQDPRELHSSFVPDIGPAGSVVGLHGLFLDITARKMMDKQAAHRRLFEERLSRLTSDERNVYELLVEGKANKSVAHHLDIGLRTAERRRQIILEKLGVESMAELLQELTTYSRDRPT